MKVVLSYIVVIFMLTAVLTGCGNSNDPIEPLETTRVPYDLEQAAALIHDMEEPIAALLSRSTISRGELQVIQQQAQERYLANGSNVTDVFFDMADMENEQISELPLLTNMFYPILKHKSIELTEAYIDKTIYAEEHSFFNSEFLYIKEAFTGDDPLLRDHYRAYIFKKDAQGEWVFNNFDGTINYSGEGFTSTFLPYK